MCSLVTPQCYGYGLAHCGSTLDPDRMIALSLILLIGGVVFVLAVLAVVVVAFGYAVALMARIVAVVAYLVGPTTRTR